MKVYIATDELYPAYWIQKSLDGFDDWEKNGYDEFDFPVDQETIDRWIAAHKEFAKARREISELIKAKEEPVDHGPKERW